MNNQQRLFTNCCIRFTEGGYGSSSSYSRRTAGSFSSEGYTSSRYGSDSHPSTDSYLTGSSKYDDRSSKYTSKRSALGETESSYSPRLSSKSDIDNDSKYSSALSKSSLDESYSFSKSRARKGDDDVYGSYSARSSRSVTNAGDGLGDDENYSYSRRTMKSRVQDTGEDDDYNFSRRSIKSRNDADNDTGSYYTRKSLRTSTEGSITEGDGYNSKLGIDSIGSKYSRRSISTDMSESKYAKTGEDEDLLSKYTSKYSRQISGDKDEEEDKYAKYTRKYSRTDSLNENNTKKTDDDYKYSRSISRSDSTKEKVEEEDPYEKYAKKYLKKESAPEAVETTYNIKIKEEETIEILDDDVPTKTSKKQKTYNDSLDEGK